MKSAPGRLDRRGLLRAGGALLLAAQGPALVARARAQCVEWARWTAFQAQFISADGRLIDPSSDRAHSVSEGQAYALFFALAANDRGAFERILRWTENNLAAGDLTAHLPAWRWGRRDDASYGVIDANPAADADLWLVYALGEAGRLWGERRYVALSSLLAERVLREETVELPGLGRTLLPGAYGFALEGGRWRLNPSYLPPFILTWLAARSRDARWAAIRESGLRVLEQSAPRGLAPDWTLWRSQGGNAGAFETDAASPDAHRGSFDAIRVYLWLGMTSREDAASARLLAHFSPMADLVGRQGAAPASVDALSGVAGPAGSPGFCLAVLPYLDTLGRFAAASDVEARVRASPPEAHAYFEQALAMFASGWREGRFAFAADGSLVPAWRSCKPDQPQH
jgi:endoglucanase